MKVCVPQCPNGARAPNRWPLRLRPRKRVILVFTKVSSTNTSRCGCSRMRGWRWAVQTRRSSRMSARAHSAAICCFFIREALPAEQTGQSGGSRADAMLLPEAGCQLRHGDVRLGLYHLHQEGLVGHQLAAPRRAALPSRGGRSGLRLTSQQLDGKAVADPEVTGSGAARMAGLDKARDPHAKIQGIAATHDPPPSTEGITARPGAKPGESYFQSDALACSNRCSITASSASSGGRRWWVCPRTG